MTRRRPARTVSLGIYVHTDPARLLATIRAVNVPGAHAIEIMILADGPDRVTRDGLAALDLPLLVNDQAVGGAACFNRLAAETRGEVAILLESGALPAPGALDRLVDALGGGVPAGLAGPSTNHAWNEQCAFPGRAGTPADVQRIGQEAVRRFGEQTRSLAPLHSLSDFCYAVDRAVIEAIGGADEGYGLGPCWEMEYSTRAARAGFQGVWVCGAYVWRAPLTPRRRLEERRRFEHSRHRYQDSLCGLRLRGEGDGYAEHCLGERCEHFAPRELIVLRRPLPEASARAVESARAGASADGAPSPPREPAVARASGGEPPLVSCVMPTGNRADFALQAVRLFQRQHYEPRELIVVDNGHDHLEERLPPDARIRYLRAVPGDSIGAKRNRACAEARGRFIAQWDDDDWYGARRLSVQLEPLISGRADLTGLRMPVFFELDRWRSWTVSEALHRRLFVKNVHGGTLAFTRQVWERLSRYPNSSLAEDAAFLSRAVARGGRLEAIEGDARLYVYMRHGANAWRFTCGSYLDREGWRSADEPPFPADDRDFYAARSPVAPPAPARPLVSCIMPTADRREWVARALVYFQRQDYLNRELVILDDGEDRVEDLIPGDPRVRYIPLAARLILGEKRNRACELAEGEVIVHWDDDDWQAPHRLRYQVEALDAHGAGMCGPDKALYVDPASQRAWLYAYPRGPRPWIAGNALCYRRSLWQENRFASVAVGEDTRFVWSPRAGEPLVLPDHRFFVALIHATNSNRKVTAGAYWSPRPLEEIRSLVGVDWERYVTPAAVAAALL